MCDILERAIIRVDINELIRLWSVIEHDTYRFIILVNIDHLWIKMNDQLFSHLSQVFIDHNYVEVYNRIFLMNRFHLSLKNSNYLAIKDLYVQLLKEGIQESILLNILANNCKDMLKHNQIALNSLLATYFCNSPYIEEYQEVCISIVNMMQH